MESLLNTWLLIGSILLLVSVIISKSSNKFGLPILVLFMFVGMLAGNDGVGGIQYEDYELTHSLSLVAICLIIFAGGLSTKSEDIKSIVQSGISLSSLGIVLTTAFVALVCHYGFNINPYESALIGAILSSTDAAAVFTAFRDRDSQVPKRVRGVLEFESGSNDPMAYLLVSLFLGFYLFETSFSFETIKFATLNIILGLIGGFSAFKAFEFINDKIELDFQGLYPALTIGFLFLTYSSVTTLEGNGFLAVYILGLKVGNTKIIHKNSLIAFFDGVSWLFQIGLFIMLGLLVNPTRLADVAITGSALALFLIFAARPLSIFISLAKSDFNVKEKLFISWAGLKGATPIVFASMVATRVGVESHFIFDIVFFVVLISALLQGSTMKWFAKKMNLLIEAIYDPEFPVDLEIIEKTKNGIKEIQIKTEDFAVDKRIIDLNLPKGSLVLFIKRANGFIIPDGSTTFKEHDRVLVVTSEKSEIENAINHFRVNHVELNPEDEPLSLVA